MSRYITAEELLRAQVEDRLRRIGEGDVLGITQPETEPVHDESTCLACDAAVEYERTHPNEPVS